MDEVAWTVTEASGDVTVTGKRSQLAYKEPFEITDKTAKGQIAFIEGWNAMRQCLLDNGLMEPK